MSWALYRRELRSRQRGLRAFILPVVSAGVLGIGLVLAMMAMSHSYERRSSVLLERGMGRDLFMVLAFLQLGIAVLLAPSFTAGAVVGERDQKTIELLAATLLRPTAVLVQKFLSALSSMLVFLSVALPVVALCYSLGGISISEIALFYLVLMITIVSFGGIGLLCSAVAQRTYLSYALTYLAVGYLSVGCFIATGLMAFVMEVVLSVSIDYETLGNLLIAPSPLVPVLHAFGMDLFPGGEHLLYFFVLHLSLIVICWVFALGALRRRYRFH